MAPPSSAMPYLSSALALLLVAVVPLVYDGEAILTFSFTTHDARHEVRLTSAADSEAALTLRRPQGGAGDLMISTRAWVEGEDVRYVASADVLARLPGGGLREGELFGLARSSHAVVQTIGRVSVTERRVRPTEVRVFIERVTQSEVHGSFLLVSDREEEARVSGRFVAPRPTDV